MSKQIKASEVREGMEIEWTSRGWYHRGVVYTVIRNDHVGVWVQSWDGFEMSVEPDQVFTVLFEPQPVEPTAFGACVTVDIPSVGVVRYHRGSGNADYSWVGDDSGRGEKFKWSGLCARGPVTVVNADPFAEVL